MLSSLFGASGPSTPPAATMPSATPDDPAAAMAQLMKEEQASRPYDLLLKLGLGLMASKNPSFAGALGDAGAAALQGQEDAGTKALKRYMLQQQVSDAGQKATDRQTLRRALAGDKSLSDSQRTLILQNPDAAKEYLKRSMGSGLRLMDGTTIGGGPMGGSAAPEMPGAGGTTTTVKPLDPASFAPDLDMKIGMLEEKYGLPSGSFRSLVQAESSGRQTLPNGQVNTSPAGALGLTQLMPGTAKDLGVDPTNPDQNLEGGARYLKQQLDKYGNLDHAYVAYNWGPGNADSWIKAGADPAKLPAETRAYLATNKGISAQPGVVQVADAGTTATDASPAGTAPPQRYVGQGLRSGARLQPVQDANGNIVSGWGFNPQTRQVEPLDEGRATNEQKDYAEAVRGGYPGSFFDYQRDLKKAGKTEINMTQSGEKKGSEKLYNDAAEAFSTSQAAARTAQRNRTLYDDFGKAIEGFRPGAGADTRLAAGQILQGMGINVVPGVSEGELAKSIGAQLELAAGQMMKGQGQITENERAILKAAIPSLTTTLEGNRKVIDLMKRLDAHDLEVARVYRENARKNGGIVDPVSVAEEVAALGSPLSSREMSDLQKAGAPRQGGQSAPGTAPTAAPAAPGQPSQADIEAEMRRRGLLK